MGKKVRFSFVVVCGFLMSLLFGETVFAENQLNDMTIEVQLQEDGSAVITEQREMNMDDGTELYIVLEELQDSELLDFSVAGFEEVENWDLDASIEEKAGKYGVLDTGDGQELVWGIGEYGDNFYEVTYSLSNLVRELEDGQALLWNFDTFSDIPAENLTVEITGPEPFTENNVRLWGFGFEGDIQLVDGRVIWEAAEEVDNSNDVTVLLQFPPGLFQTQASVDMTLEEQQEMAMDGSAYNRDTSGGDLFGIIIISGITLVGAGAAGTAITYGVKVNKAKKEAGQMQSGAQRMSENKGLVFDDIPFAGEDIAGIAYLLHDLGKGYFEDYFSAYLLKWTMEERIEIKTKREEKVFGESFDTVIEIFDYAAESERYNRSFADMVHQLPMSQEETYETGLWLMLLDAADRNGIVSDEQMKRWAKAHAKEVEVYADYLADYSKDYLEEHGLIAFEDIYVWNATHEVAKASREGDKLFDRLVQFDNYLEEVELAGLQEAQLKFSVEEYLMWSTLYYRSEEITKQFKEMMPDTVGVDDSYPMIHYYWYWNGMYGFRRNWSTGLANGGFHSSASSAPAAGGGGATSFGGGMGAGGGGGGGAR